MPSNIIKIPFPELLDVMEALAHGESYEPTLDLEMGISKETAKEIKDLISYIEDEASRNYYLGKVESWLNLLNSETTTL